MKVSMIPKGIRVVMRNLNKEIRALQGEKTIAGLLYAAAEIKRVAEPITPLDIGNLRASFFIVTASEIRSDLPVFKDHPIKKKVTAEALQNDYDSITREGQAIAGRKRKTPMVALGYSANYAAPVHEKVDAHFKGKGQAKWFEKAVKEVTPKVLKIIAANIKIP